jgi:glycosyltransferase involved in cell wall biosynthesis
MATYKPDWDNFHSAMKSIQAQTFTRFKVILVNDGTDDTELKKQMRVYPFEYQIITNVENLGLTRSLNKGLQYCTAKYIARFDDDDIMEPERLEKQFDYMESHCECAAVFTNIERIDSQGNHVSTQTGDNTGIEHFLLMRGNCLCHSTLFIRKKVLMDLNGYDDSMLYAQDYDLYLRMLEKYTFYKLPQPLVKFRQNSIYTPLNKKIMSMCCSYYASMKYVQKHRAFGMFVSRTLRFSVGIFKIVFNNKICE